MKAMLKKYLKRLQKLCRESFNTEIYFISVFFSGGTAFKLLRVYEDTGNRRRRKADKGRLVSGAGQSQFYRFKYSGHAEDIHRDLR